MKKKPVFVLGVGAQKSGTSWLHQLLQSQSWANFGRLKEYHVWDALTCGLCSEFMVSDELPLDQSLVLRRKMQQDEQFYVDYFREKVSRHASVTGDITPSYAMLDADAFEKIEKLLTGFDVKVIFLMRDPVERIWSALRMDKRNLQAQGRVFNEFEMQDGFFKNLQQPFAYERTNYPETIRHLERVFRSDQLWFGLYESLFRSETVDSLSKFLGYEIENAPLATKVNASPQVSLGREAREQAKTYLAPIYAYCASRFPETGRLWGEAAWPPDA